MPDAYTHRPGRREGPRGPKTTFVTSRQWLVASVYWRSISAAARAMQVAGVPRSASHWLLLGRHLGGVTRPTPAHPPATNWVRMSVCLTDPLRRLLLRYY
ncbi:hypothetical protein B5X24_HaOG210243 [Helicoverpa armigera]|nr:hypothetical protein B5X24_HaOG210243 [Helicoverpa armigera]